MDVQKKYERSNSERDNRKDEATDDSSDLRSRDFNSIDKRMEKKNTPTTQTTLKNISSSNEENVRKQFELNGKIKVTSNQSSPKAPNSSSTLYFHSFLHRNFII
jgi:hypothetical protein